MKIIVDLFNQHSANLEDLKRMALSAWISGADCAKLQIFTSKSIWGDDSRKYLEMTYDQVVDFKNYCDNIGIEFAATAFDKERVDWLESLNVKYHKVASVTSKNNTELVEYILSKNKPTIISLGQYDDNVFPFGFDSNIKYMYCVSKYPTLLSDNRVRNMPNFNSSKYNGYSDHTLGIAAAIKSYFLGSELLEKHFTFSNFAQRPGELAHLCSFTPETLRQYTNLVKEFDIMKKE